MRAYEVPNAGNNLMYLRDIERKGIKVALYEVLSGGNRLLRYVALTSERNLPLENVNELVIEEYNKVPVYKQAMNMQMGRKVKTFTSENVTYRLRALDKDRNFVYRVVVARIG